VSELTLVLIRFAYLAILWIFVLSAISVVRSDMFGARVESMPRSERRADKRARKQSRNKDLGSTNGTYIGSTRITQPTTLQLGTQIRIGKTILELKK
jgi:pSer/pThr/pTyr-binding forkhead associated (FHA) protein